MELTRQIALATLAARQGRTENEILHDLHREHRPTELALADLEAEQAERWPMLGDLAPSTELKYCGSRTGRIPAPKAATVGDNLPHKVVPDEVMRQFREVPQYVPPKTIELTQYECDALVESYRSARPEPRRVWQSARPSLLPGVMLLVGLVAAAIIVTVTI